MVYDIVKIGVANQFDKADFCSSHYLNNINL